MDKKEGVPKYLQGWGESRWQKVAKFRLRNGMRGNRYWMDEGKCRMCGNGEETWQHVWEECMEWGRGGKR